MDDEEYFWEPVPGSWSVRRRSEAVSTKPQGRGVWAFDNAQEEQTPAPFTTIAWRLMHLTDSIGSYQAFLWGEGLMADDWLEVPGTAADGVALWEKHTTAIAEALEAEDDAALERPIRIPWWPREAPRWEVVANVVVEATHHGAEIGVLRDLYALYARRSSGIP
jgi:uncharacterized damage-inducible protein DinB